jgi:hypothetical protein
VLPSVRQEITVLEPSAPASAGIQTSSRSGTRWPPWLWCNLVSLDAPVVAVLWQSLFAHCFAVHLSTTVSAALAFAVWLIYMADRMLDAVGLTSLAAAAPRHVFCRQHWVTLGAAATAGLFVLGGLCLALPRPIFRNGLILLVAIGVYFVVVHVRSLKLRRYWPKEIVVGCLFSAGTCLAVWSETSSRLHIEMAVLSLLFAALCSLNCVAIEYWESHARSALPSTQQPLTRVPFLRTFFDNESPSPLTLTIGRHLAQTSLAIAAAAALFLFASTAALRPFFLAIVLSALALFQLSRPSQRLSTSSRRVLVDIALLTPLLVIAVR